MLKANILLIILSVLVVSPVVYAGDIISETLPAEAVVVNVDAIQPAASDVTVNAAAGTAEVAINLDKVEQNITISILDSVGKVVKTLHSGSLESGHHAFAWDGTNDSGTSLSSAAYSVEVSQINSSYRQPFSYEAAPQSQMN